MKKCSREEVEDDFDGEKHLCFNFILFFVFVFSSM
jgi:hypothetical protein